LAAQGKIDVIICERCFASVKTGSEFCPECGAPMGKGQAEGSDAAIYPELARANLLRMRGDYAAALTQCRSILRKFPNNVTANQLLGDICVETDDLEQAKEWYELALDIAPDSAQIEKKLSAVRQRLEHQETEGLVEQLGLPPSKPKNGLLALGLATLVLGVGIIAYLVGMNVTKKTTSAGPKRTTVNAPLETPQNGATSGGSDKGDPGPGTMMSPGSGASAVGTTEERGLMQLLGQRSTEGAKVTSVALDPRSGLLAITFNAGGSEDARTVAAKLAEAAFENNPTTRIVTLRAIRDGNLAYTADAHRETYEETKTDAWKAQNANDPTALARHILTQEWPADTGATATNGAASPNDGQTNAPSDTGTGP